MIKEPECLFDGVEPGAIMVLISSSMYEADSYKFKKCEEEEMKQLKCMFKCILQMTKLSFDNQHPHRVSIGLVVFRKCGESH